MKHKDDRREFGVFIRRRREERRKNGDRRCSVRGFADQVGLQPSYLSRIERRKEAPPSEEKIRRIAAVLGEDPDLLLAKAGKIAADLQAAIQKRPRVLAELIRVVKTLPDSRIQKMIRAARGK